MNENKTALTFNQWKQRLATSHSTLRGDTDATQKYYNELSQDYDALLGSWDYNTPNICAQLVNNYFEKKMKADQSKIGEKLEIYDCGCGTGLVGKYLKDLPLFKSANIHGTDIAENALEMAKERNIYENIQQWNMHCKPFPFADNFFDAVICSGVLSYVNSKPELFAEWTRIVKNGGVIAVSHRSDYLWGENRNEKKDILLWEQMVGDGNWKLIEHSEPYPYLHGNENYEQKNVTAEYLLYEVVRAKSLNTL